jgi:glutamyl-Q tRNA(Asp) synthetase
MKNEAYAWRLDMRAVEEKLGRQLFWTDTEGEQYTFDVSEIGDVVIGRKDIQYSYHLTVVIDDAEQDMTHIIRGEDLRESTPVHTILQQLLGYKAPIYLHHPLITDVKGQRLAKTKHSTALNSLRNEGFSALKIRGMLGF